LLGNVDNSLVNLTVIYFLSTLPNKMQTPKTVAMGVCVDHGIEQDLQFLQPLSTMEAISGCIVKIQLSNLVASVVLR